MVLKCDLKHFHKHVLRQLSQEIGASGPSLYVATKLLHLKPYKYAIMPKKAPGGRVFCDGTLF
jgi:hypothetical protein